MTRAFVWFFSFISRFLFHALDVSRMIYFLHSHPPIPRKMPTSFLLERWCLLNYSSCNLIDFNHVKSNHLQSCQRNDNKTCVKTISVNLKLIWVVWSVKIVPLYVPRNSSRHTRLQIINKNQKQQAQMPNALSVVYTYLA